MCKEGSVLTPEQAKLLELLEYRLAKFQLILKACWIKDKGFEMLQKDVEEDDDEEMKEDSD